MRLFNLQISFYFSIKRVKRISFDIPYWAKDVGVYKNTCIRYFKGFTPYYIEIPRCKKAECIFVDKMYIVENRKKLYNKNRQIVLDVFY
jgi:hypothetical protein